MLLRFMFGAALCMTAAILASSHEKDEQSSCINLVEATTHERTERFDRDPGWDASNNHSIERRTVRQDFGYSPTAHAGGKRGELGGFISPAAEPAYYAKKILPQSFNDRLSASGTL